MDRLLLHTSQIKFGKRNKRESLNIEGQNTRPQKGHGGQPEQTKGQAGAVGVCATKCLRIGGALGLVLGEAHAGAACLLAPVLCLLDLLAARLCLLSQASADRGEFVLNLLQGLYGIIDAHEAKGSAATELCAESLEDDALLVGHLVPLEDTMVEQQV